MAQYGEISLASQAGDSIFAVLFSSGRVPLRLNEKARIDS